MKDKQLLLAVLAQLEREKTVSIPQLARLLGATEERVFDALETLVFAYDAASIRLDLHDTYASLETHGSERLMRLTVPEADALVDALTNAGFSAADELVRAIMQAKSVLADRTEDAGPRLRTVSETPAPDIAQTIAAACEDMGHHVLEIAYRREGDTAPQLRRIEPARIFSQGGHRYLQAFCREARAWRTFRISRIDKARQLDERFSPHEDMPPSEITLKRTGCEARVLLDSDCPLPHWRGLRIAQTLEDGARVAIIPWTGSSWLPRHVVALMGKAVAIEPPEFADACKEVALSLRASSSVDE